MRLWVLMALASTTLSGMSLYGAAAYADDAMPVYDLGSDDVYDTYETPKEEAAPPEPKEAEPAPVPEEQPPQTFAGGQVSTTSHMGALGDKKILDVPFNVVGISSKTIEDQQAKDVSDVTSNDSSVSDQTLSGASSAWNIRGFKTTQQDVQWDGIYGVGPRFYSGVEAVERVDVIKGPSALLGGLPPNGTVGGTINFVPKRAEDTPTRDLTVSLGAGAQLTETSMSASARKTANTAFVSMSSTAAAVIRPMMTNGKRRLASTSPWIQEAIATGLPSIWVTSTTISITPSIALLLG